MQSIFPLLHFVAFKVTITKGIDGCSVVEKLQCKQNKNGVLTMEKKKTFQFRQTKVYQQKFIISFFPLDQPSHNISSKQTSRHSLWHNLLCTSNKAGFLLLLQLTYKKVK